jgi:hypothetical protein
MWDQVSPLVCNEEMFYIALSLRQCVVVLSSTIHAMYIDVTISDMLWLPVCCAWLLAWCICSFYCVKSWCSICQSWIVEAEDKYVLFPLKSDLLFYPFKLFNNLNGWFHRLWCPCNEGFFNFGTIVIIVFVKMVFQLLQSASVHFLSMCYVWFWQLLCLCMQIGFITNFCIRSGFQSFQVL